MDSDAQGRECDGRSDDEATSPMVRRVLYALMLAPVLAVDLAHLDWFVDLPGWLRFTPGMAMAVYALAVTCVHGFLFALVVGDPEPEKNGPHPIRRADAWIGSAIVLGFWLTPFVLILGSYAGLL